MNCERRTAHNKLKLGVLAGMGLGLALVAPGQQLKQAGEAAGQSTSDSPDVPRLVPRTHEDRELSFHADHRIILNVMVTDAEGRSASGLTQQDFALIDGAQSRQITSFRGVKGDAANINAHVLLVLDAVNSSVRNLAVQHKEIEKYLTKNRGRIAYPISLVLVSGSGSRVEPPSRDADILVDELRRLTTGLHAMDCGDPSSDGSPKSYTAFGRVDALDSLDRANDTGDSRAGTSGQAREAKCLNQRFMSSVSALNKLVKGQVDVPGRAIVIWVGPGWPLLTGPGFRPDTPAARRKHFDYLAELSLSLREAQVTLDSVSSPDLFRHPEPGAETSATVAPAAADEADPRDFALPLLVRQTGGQVLSGSKDLAGEIAASINDANAYYVLSFDAQPAAGVGEYRTLDVKVDKPGLTVRTNAAYFAAP